MASKILALRQQGTLIALLLVCLGACTDDTASVQEPLQEDDTDQRAQTDGETDAPFDSDDRSPDKSDRVAVELNNTEADVPSETAVQVSQISSDAQLIESRVADGQVGDYLLQNGEAKFVIEGDRRAMSPCPYGGNLIDAVVKEESLHGGQTDLMGEICLGLNITQTFEPDRYEILQDGSDTGVGMLAVTGDLAQLDFIDLDAMAKRVQPGLLEQVAIPIGDMPELTVTIYYILRPETRGLETVTAFRNNSDHRVHFTFSHLVRTGGAGAFFNPISKRKGFGSVWLDRRNISGAPMPLVAAVGEKSSYAFVPEPQRDLSRFGFPLSGAYFTRKGVALTMWQTDNIGTTILGNEQQLKEDESIIHLDAGAKGKRMHRVYVGDRRLQSVLEPAYDQLGVKTAEVEGRVVDRSGATVEGVRVAAVKKEANRTFSRSRTNAEGRFRMTVPPGEYEFLARAEGRYGKAAYELKPDSESSSDVEIEVNEPGSIEVHVTNPADDPIPARVSIKCVGSCPNPPTYREEDVGFDSPPGGFAKFRRIGADGEKTIQLLPGEYRVSVSRGLTWSIWPKHADESGGKKIEIEPGEQLAESVELAKVVDTTGVLSGDFHVHSIKSSDSRIRLDDRVRQFMSEGTEVIVSTDHDVITDYTEVIDELNGSDFIASVPGDEITTAVTGHFNGFPLRRDADEAFGGALDWGNGAEPSLTPESIFDWVKEFPGEQVVQLNHPASPPSGMIAALDVDVLRGLSTVSAESLDIRAPDDVPDGPGTGLWTESFTAMEVLNGHSTWKFRTVMRWWLTMVGRGFSPTGTAVSDTYTLHGNLGGSPRSFVFVGSEHDTPSSFDRNEFAESINAGRLIGSNGPFFRASVQNDDGESAGLGGTLAAPSGEVTVKVIVDIPVWMDVGQLELYVNEGDVITGPGERVGKALSPSYSEKLEFGEPETRVVAEGNRKHRNKRTTVSVPITVEGDAYVVAAVRGKGNSGNLYPVVPNREVNPIAFANPIYIDVDGGGYNNPPLQEKAKTPPSRESELKARDAHHHHGDTHGREGHSHGQTTGRSDSSKLKQLLGPLMTNHQHGLHAVEN